MLELAAGIGRFTGILAQKAKSLTVVELIENFIKANQKTNGVEWQLKCIYLLCMYYDLISSFSSGHMKNIRFMHKDASKLAFDNDVFDIIFSSWILIYLTDEEVSAWDFPHSFS